MTSETMLRSVGKAILLVILLLIVLSLTIPKIFTLGKQILGIAGEKTGTKPVLPNIGEETGDSCSVAASLCQLPVTTTAPSMSVDQIKALLDKGKSPAIQTEPGIAQVFWDKSRETGVDVAIALAFFQHESNFGKSGMATITKSMGNIIYNDVCRTKYNGQNESGFCKYPTWKAGVEAWYNLIKDGYIENLKLTTLGPIIATYAPCIENNVKAYIASVKEFVDQYTTRDVSSCRIEQ